MVLFSTILKINEKLTKERFVKLVLEWNNTGSFKENIVRGIKWNGEYNVKYGDEKLSLEFAEYPEKQILAVRHEKVTDDSIVWDTDYIVNFEEKQISIRLDRTYREDALIMDGAFSTPHFITLLIEAGYLAEDNGLPVLRTPVEITDENTGIIKQFAGGKVGFQLPVIFVSRAAGGELPLSTEWLASRLKGVAHVLVEKDRESCEECRKIFAETKEEFGAVRIYYPSESISRKRFLYRSAGGNSGVRLEKVIKNVIQYRNSQMMEMLYSWQGVTNAVLSSSLSSQINRLQEAESARESAENEVNQIYEAFDEELKNMQKKLEELTRINEALMIENSGLRAKFNASDSMPVVYQGEEEDFYPEEIKDMILSVLDEALTNTEESTRRADILEDILENNVYQHLSEKRKQRIKAIFKGQKNLSGAMKQELMDLGLTISDDGKHYKMTYKNDPRYMVTIGKTPSDSRAGNNNAAMINKIMM